VFSALETDGGSACDDAPRDDRQSRTAISRIYDYYSMTSVLGTKKMPRSKIADTKAAYNVW